MRKLSPTDFRGTLDDEISAENLSMRIRIDALFIEITNVKNDYRGTNSVTESSDLSEEKGLLDPTVIPATYINIDITYFFKVDISDVLTRRF